MNPYRLIIFDWEGTLKAINPYKVELNPGAIAVIQQLKQQACAIGIATGCGTQALKRELQQLGLESWFDATRTAEQTCSKPHPLMLEEIFEELNCKPFQALMVGDNVCDMEMARAAGCDALGVDFSQGTAAQLLDAGAKQVIQDYANFFEALKTMEV